MKILFDQGTPAPLRHVLAGHSVSTAYEMGWMELGNDALLRAAESRFDAFITTDRAFAISRTLPATDWRF